MDTSNGPSHRTSLYSGYTNWGIGYSLFERVAIAFRLPQYFDEEYSLAFILAYLLRWKRTYFSGNRRDFFSLPPTAWSRGETVPLHIRRYKPSRDSWMYPRASSFFRRLKWIFCE